MFPNFVSFCGNFVHVQFNFASSPRQQGPIFQEVSWVVSSPVADPVQDSRSKSAADPFGSNPGTNLGEAFHLPSEEPKISGLLNKTCN